MRRIVSVTAAALLAGAVAGCGGSKDATLPADAKNDLGKTVNQNPEAKTKAEKNKGAGVGMD